MTEMVLLDRERELDERELDLDARERELGVRERALDRHAHTIDAIGLRVRDRGRELERRERTLDERERHPLRWFAPWFDASPSTSDATDHRRGGVNPTLVLEDEAVERLRAPSGGGGAPAAGAAVERGGGTAAGGSLSGCTDPGSANRQLSDAPAGAVSSPGAENASDRCREAIDPRRRRRFLVLGPSIEQIELWRRRNGLAPFDVDAINTSRPPLGVDAGHPDHREIVLLDGWRRGAYAERITWELARQGFDFSPAACTCGPGDGCSECPPERRAPRGISPRATPARRGRPDTLVGEAAGRLGDQLVDELPDRCELALVCVTAVVRRPDGSLTGSTSSATAANGWGQRRAA